MKTIIRDLVRSTVISIAMAMVIFCLVGIVFDISAGGTFSLDHYRFTKMVVGCLLIGLGFGVPSVVYRNDKLPVPVKVIIHMGIGLVIYTVVGYAVGWIGSSAKIWQGLIIVVIQLAVAFIIWLIFIRHYRMEAEKINKRIQEKK